MIDRDSFVLRYLYCFEIGILTLKNNYLSQFYLTTQKEAYLNSYLFITSSSYTMTTMWHKCNRLKFCVMPNLHL